MNYIYEMPAEMLKECDKKGTVERFEYESRVYDKDDGTDDNTAATNAQKSAEKLQKGAWVYVPYGYDASKKYDILYLMHGGSRCSRKL